MAPPRYLDQDELKQQYFDSAILSDIILCIGEHKIYAHKMILALGSCWFRRAFASNQLEDTNASELRLDEDDLDATMATLKYIYGYPVREIFDKSSIDFHLQVCTMAEKYEVAALYQYSVLLIISDLHRARYSESGYQIIETILDKTRVSGRELKLQVIEFCSRYAEELLPNEEFREILLKYPELGMGILDRRLGYGAKEYAVELDDFFDWDTEDHIEEVMRWSRTQAEEDGGEI